jgi:hypothetical protein
MVVNKYMFQFISHFESLVKVKENFFRYLYSSEILLHRERITVKLDFTGEFFLKLVGRMGTKLEELPLFQSNTEAENAI